MLHRFPEGLGGEKVHQKRLPHGAPPWVETVRVDFPVRTPCRRAVRDRAGQCHLGGADVHRRVPPVELPARGHRAPGRVADRPRPHARVRLRHGAPGRARRPRGARRARRGRLAEDLGRRGPARLRPDRAPLGLRRRAACRAGLRPRGRAPRAGRRDHHVVAQGPRPDARCSSTTTRTPATTRSPAPTRCAGCRRRRCRRRSRGTRSTTSSRDDFTIATVPARFAELGDLHAGIDDAVFSLDTLLDWAARDEREGVPDPGGPADVTAGRPG